LLQARDLGVCLVELFEGFGSLVFFLGVALVQVLQVRLEVRDGGLVRRGYLEHCDLALFGGHELGALVDQRLELEQAVFFFAELLPERVQVVELLLDGRFVLAERAELCFVLLVQLGRLGLDRPELACEQLEDVSAFPDARDEAGGGFEVGLDVFAAAAVFCDARLEDVYLFLEVVHCLRDAAGRQVFDFGGEAVELLGFADQVCFFAVEGFEGCGLLVEQLGELELGERRPFEVCFGLEDGCPEFFELVPLGEEGFAVQVVSSGDQAAGVEDVSVQRDDADGELAVVADGVRRVQRVADEELRGDVLLHHAEPGVHRFGDFFGGRQVQARVELLRPSTRLLDDLLGDRRHAHLVQRHEDCEVVQALFVQQLLDCFGRVDHDVHELAPGACFDGFDELALYFDQSERATEDAGPVEVWVGVLLSGDYPEVHVEVFWLEVVRPAAVAEGFLLVFDVLELFLEGSQLVGFELVDLAVDLGCLLQRESQVAHFLFVLFDLFVETAHAFLAAQQVFFELLQRALVAGFLVARTEQVVFEGFEPLVERSRRFSARVLRTHLDCELVLLFSEVCKLFFHLGEGTPAQLDQHLRFGDFGLALGLALLEFLDFLRFGVLFFALVFEVADLRREVFVDGCDFGLPVCDFSVDVFDLREVFFGDVEARELVYFEFVLFFEFAQVFEVGLAVFQVVPVRGDEFKVVVAGRADEQVREFFDLVVEVLELSGLGPFLFEEFESGAEVGFHAFVRDVKFFGLVAHDESGLSCDLFVEGDSSGLHEHFEDFCGFEVDDFGDLALLHEEGFGVVDVEADGLEHALGVGEGDRGAVDVVLGGVVLVRRGYRDAPGDEDGVVLDVAVGAFGLVSVVEADGHRGFLDACLAALVDQVLDLRGARLLRGRLPGRATAGRARSRSRPGCSTCPSRSGR